MSKRALMPTFVEGGSQLQAWQLRAAKAAFEIVRFINNIEIMIGSCLREEVPDESGRLVDATLSVPIRHLNALRNALGWLPTHAHLKTGGHYRLLAPATRETNLELTAVYENELGQVWTRPMAEFLDGRFKPLDGFEGIHEEMKQLLQIEIEQRGSYD